MDQLDESTINRMWDFAAKLAPAKFLPEHSRGDVASLFYQLATGQELGIGWMHAIRSTFPGRDGGLGMKGDVILALLQTRGFKVDFAFGDKPVGCTCTITRPEAGSAPVSRAFTMDDAQLIETWWDPAQDRWHRLAENYFYRNFGATMCQWRSLVICARVAAADVTGGLYLMDELSEATEPKGASFGSARPAPPAEEFVVGEKPAPPAETAAVVESDGPGPARVEDVAPASATPAPAPPIHDPATPFIIKVVVEKDGEQFLKDSLEPPQSHKDSALLRARALANQFGVTFVVWDEAKGVEVAICNPLAAAPAPPPAPTPKESLEVPPPAPPANIHPVDTAPAAAPPSFDDLIVWVRAKIGGEARVANKLIARYFGSFLQVDPIPKDRAKLLPPLQELVKVIDAKVGDLKSDPEALGAALAGRAISPLDEECKLLSWPPALRATAREVMKFAGQAEKPFVEWLHMAMAGDSAKGTAVSIANLEPAAAEVFFRLYLLARGRAFELADWSVAHQQSTSKAYTDMATAAGIPMDKWDAPFVGRCLDAVKAVSAGTAPAAQPQIPDDGFMSGGLPFED